MANRDNIYNNYNIILYYDIMTNHLQSDVLNLKLEFIYLFIFSLKLKLKRNRIQTSFLNLANSNTNFGVAYFV